MFIVSLFWTLVRVAVFVCCVLGLLRVRKTRLRHVPTRRTRISRHHGESTLWLERLLNAVIDMLHYEARMQAAAEEAERQRSRREKEAKETTAGRRSSEATSAQSPRYPSSRRGSLPSLSSAVGTEFKSFAKMFGKQPAERSPSPPPTGRGSPSAQRGNAWTRLPEGATTSKPDESDEDAFFHGADDLDDVDDSTRPQFLVQLEERVNAILEDGGIAAWSDFRVRSLGDQPPRVKAIHIIHAGLTQNAPPSNSAVNPNVKNAQGHSQAANFAQPPHPQHNQQQQQQQQQQPRTGTVDWGNGGPVMAGPQPGDTGDVGSTKPPSPKPGYAPSPGSATGMQPPSAGGSASVNTVHLGGGTAPSANDVMYNGPSVAGPSTTPGGTAGSPSSTASGGGAVNGAPAIRTGPTVSSTIGNNATTIEFEAEIEYSGGLDVSLRADLSFLRGRQLPFQVRLNKVKYARAHVHVAATLHHDTASVDTPLKPYLLATVWFESDPAFDLSMRTSVTPLNIRDFFLLPILTKFALLRFIRAKLKRSNGGAGISVKIPLPEDIVDGGELWSHGGGGAGMGGTDVGSMYDDGRSAWAATAVSGSGGIGDASSAFPRGYWGSTHM